MTTHWDAVLVGAVVGIVVAVVRAVRNGRRS